MFGVWRVEGTDVMAGDDKVCTATSEELAVRIVAMQGALVGLSAVQVRELSSPGKLRAEPMVVRLVRSLATPGQDGKPRDAQVVQDMAASFMADHDAIDVSDDHDTAAVNVAELYLPE